MISAAITETLKTIREATQNGSDARPEGRFIAAKLLPEFNGNPLDWVHFLESYRTSTTLCGFNERENIGRLHTALRGKARDAVRTLFATATSAEKIIETLELNFGNKHTVAIKLLREIEDMPKLSSKELNLMQFVDRLDNNVMALKSIQMGGYLQNPGLLKNVTNKLPETIKFAYCRHTSELPKDAAPLEKLIEFLRIEARLAKEKGLLDLEAGIFEKGHDFRAYDERKGGNNKRRAEIYATANQQNTYKRCEGSDTKRGCVFCEKSNHDIMNCRKFSNESSKQRYNFAKKRGLCFVCLETWKPQHKCKNRFTCDYCDGNHHNLLHFLKHGEKDNYQVSRRAKSPSDVDSSEPREAAP